MATQDEQIDLSAFVVGKSYTRVEVAQLGGVTVPESIFSSNWSQGIVEFANVVLLFGTFEKDNYDYHNEFDGELFWWQTQNRQDQNWPIVSRVGSGELACFLFARLRAKTGNKAEPFVYCGALSRPAMEGAHPVTCLFKALDYVEGATGPLADIYAWRSAKPSPQEEANRRISLKRRASSTGQGRLSDTELRTALELHGMTKARDHYEHSGWTVEDTSKDNPFDLLCTRNGESRRVEVKATTTAGEIVLVTIGEVRAAQDPAFETDLFVLHDVQVSRINGQRVLSGGIAKIVSPWRPRADELHPTQFRCDVPA